MNDHQRKDLHRKMILLANGEGRVGLQPAILALQRQAAILDVVEQGIRPVETDEHIRSVGKGGAPNLLGEVECDAAIMDGSTLQAGAVGALQGYMHAISVARQVLERLPHVLIAGVGARLFAREIGAEAAELLTDEARTDLQRWLKEHLPPHVREKWPDVPLGPYALPPPGDHAAPSTTILLAMNAQGDIAGGISTSGWPYKYPGRLGDSAIIGAGLYADSRYGACACTHMGEMAIRSSTSRSVVLYMKRGASVQEACHEAADDLQGLQGGCLGPLVVYAIDRQGSPYVMSTHDLGKEFCYYLWTARGTRVQRKRPVVKSLQD